MRGVHEQHADGCGDCRFLRSEGLALLYTGRHDTLTAAMTAVMRGWQERGAKWVRCPEALKFQAEVPSG